MKKIIMLSICSAALFSACGNSTKTSSEGNTAQTMDTTKLAKGDMFYQCPMDPEIMSDKEGTCSKCGMDLQKVEKK